jgi:hypothetical protein
MLIIISILTSLLIVCFFIIWNLLRKNELAEDIIISYKIYIEKLSENIEFVDKKLIEIDNKGAFKSDDEIGFFFVKIKELQEILNQFKLNKL